MQIVRAVKGENFGIVEKIEACGDRHILGQGEIPLPDLLRANQKSGYRGAYTLAINEKLGRVERPTPALVRQRPCV